MTFSAADKVLMNFDELITGVHLCPTDTRRNAYSEEIYFVVRLPVFNQNSSTPCERHFEKIACF